MVRRDEAGRLDEERSASGCTVPVGESPISVSAGTPSSRPRVRDESRVAQAGCQEPLRREQVRGPQHEVKPAASTDSQSESRAAHATAKAMSGAWKTGGARALGLGGVRGAARVQGAVRNTRDPSVRPVSGQAGSYKPTAKASGAQRESEGSVVATMAATNNAVGAKGPCGGRVGEAGKREGMAGKTGPNRSAGCMRCMTVSAGLTSCGKRGAG
jgi:hypothetical protein